MTLCQRCSFITTRAGEKGEIIHTWASRIQGLGPSATHLSFPFSDDCSDETQASLAADVCVCRPFGCRCNSGVRLNVPMVFCPPWAPSPIQFSPLLVFMWKCVCVCVITERFTGKCHNHNHNSTTHTHTHTLDSRLSAEGMIGTLRVRFDMLKETGTDEKRK